MPSRMLISMAKNSASSWLTPAKPSSSEEKRAPTPVSEIMSVSITTIEPERDIRDAIQLMGANEIKHLPVLVEGKLAGIITFKDIIKIEPALIELLSFKSAN